MNLQILSGICELNSSGWEQRSATDSYECGNEIYGSIKIGELLDPLSNCYLLKKETVPCIYLASHVGRSTSHDSDQSLPTTNSDEITWDSAAHFQDAENSENVTVGSPHFNKFRVFWLRNYRPLHASSFQSFTNPFHSLRFQFVFSNCLLNTSYNSPTFSYVHSTTIFCFLLSCVLHLDRLCFI